MRSFALSLLISAAAASVVTAGPSDQDGIPPTTLPASRPAGESTAAKVRKLVDQLRHEDVVVRDEAATKIQKIGRPALETLREVAETEEDEVVRAWAKGLIKQIDRAPAPPARPKRPAASPPKGRPAGKTTSTEVDGKQVTVVEEPGKIKVTISETIEGVSEIRVFEAKDAGELKEKNPAAFELYEKCLAKAAAAKADGNQVIIPGPKPVE